MQSNVGRAALGVVAIATAVVLLIVLQDDGGDDETSGGGPATTEQASSKPDGPKPGKPAEPAIPTIVVRNGKPVGGIEELTFDAGERVRFEVSSNTADEVHVHGYDVEEEVAPGRPAAFDFPASIEGVFEGELHGSGEQIVELRVEP